MLPVIPEFIDADKIFLKSLSQDDALFMYQLMNTSDWLEFIGNRNIKTVADATDYIKQVENNKDLNFWVIQSKSELKRVGVITIIKKPYLNYPDIGFAMLPEFYKRGFGFDGASIMLNYYFSDFNFMKILAISLKHNIPSIGLLIKLGFEFDKEIIHEGQTMNVYSKNNGS
jgi:RimJ/RimL family protein N-acetyltransferase